MSHLFDFVEPIHSPWEFAAAYRTFQIMFTFAMAGTLSKNDGKELRELALRLSKYRREHNIKPLIYQKLKA